MDGDVYDIRQNGQAFSGPRFESWASLMRGKRDILVKILITCEIKFIALISILIKS
jgi:hypothetical protein